MLGQLYNTYKYHFRSMRKMMSEPKKKFIIVSMGRTGSTLLTSLLNSHSEIFCDSEIFMRKHHIPLFLPVIYLNGHSQNIKKHNASIYGFKVKEEQLSQENKLDSAKFLQNLHNDGWKLIRLARENRIKLALSVYQAWRDNIYEVKAGTSTKKISYINVEVDKLVEILDFHDALYKRESEALNGLRYLDLTFERDLLKNSVHQSTANKVFDYLELPHQSVSTEFKKKSDDNLRSLVKNYDELVNKLKNTKYAAFL